ncbi:transporter [Peteryoungia desertarenae]|uniref:Transporter n=1 Tax=Peteryoungia desertarenae TaxID=1813451 RepID=A0ABX6QRV4_9HYPH|nr:transporter [Peteryoungia desertarenae]
MAFNIVKSTSLALLAATAAAGIAHAGGLERGGYNIDLLFDPGQYVAESGVTYVAPDRTLKNVRDTNNGNGNLNTRATTASETESYFVPRIGFKASLTDSVDCMADYSQPWGAHTKPGFNWAGANDNAETKISSNNYALTCSYRFDVGPGQFRVIAGGFHQEVYGFKERLVAQIPAAFGTGIGRLDLEGDGYGWRIGAAYEITEYALRASLVYNSEVELDDITGTLDLRGISALVPGGGGLFGRSSPVYGSTAMPESVELKVQSGIAPGWLAFGSVKWVDWSQLQRIPFFVAGTTSPEATALSLAYRDGWTVSGGIGHKLNDQWSIAGSVTWDRGTSQGFGSQSDTWTFGTGVSYTPSENVEFRLAGALSLLTSGSSGPTTVKGVTYGNEISYDFGTDLAAAVSTSLKVRF